MHSTLHTSFDAVSAENAQLQHAVDELMTENFTLRERLDIMESVMMNGQEQPQLQSQSDTTLVFVNPSLSFKRVFVVLYAEKPDVSKPEILSEYDVS